MKLLRLSMFIFLVLAPVVVGAALPAELYWKSMLPNTAMPKAVKDLLGAENMKKVISVNQNVPLVLQLHATPMTDQPLDDPKSTLLRRELPATSAVDQLNNDPNILFYAYDREHPSTSAVDQSNNDPNILLYAYDREHPSTSAVDQLNNDPNILFYAYDRGHSSTSAVDQSNNDPNILFYAYERGHPSTSAVDQLNNDPNILFYAYDREYPSTSAVDQLNNDPNILFYAYDRGHPSTSAVDQLNNDPNILFYAYDRGHPSTSAATKQPRATLAIDQPRDDSLKVLFLFEHDLYPGKSLEMLFTKSSYSTALIPREVANTIPFSLEMVPEILKKFSIAPDSEEAKVIKKSIFYCQTPTVIKTEQKRCSTSLESMVDFITSKFGRNVEAYSNEMEKETKLQNYTIAPGVKKISDELMACHQMQYPYVVFYCHQLSASRAYFVPLEGSDGTRVKAIAVCHSDTSSWDPNHLAFRALKIKPGTVPVCHFSTADTIIWTPKKTM